MKHPQKLSNTFQKKKMNYCKLHEYREKDHDLFCEIFYKKKTTNDMVQMSLMDNRIIDFYCIKHKVSKYIQITNHMFTKILAQLEKNNNITCEFCQKKIDGYNTPFEIIEQHYRAQNNKAKTPMIASLCDEIQIALNKKHCEMDTRKQKNMDDIQSKISKLYHNEKIQLDNNEQRKNELISKRKSILNLPMTTKKMHLSKLRARKSLKKKHYNMSNNKLKLKINRVKSVEKKKQYQVQLDTLLQNFEKTQISINNEIEKIARKMYRVDTKKLHQLEIKYKEIPIDKEAKLQIKNLEIQLEKIKPQKKITCNIEETLVSFNITFFKANAMIVYIKYEKISENRNIQVLYKDNTIQWFSPTEFRSMGFLNVDIARKGIFEKFTKIFEYDNIMDEKNKNVKYTKCTNNHTTSLTRAYRLYLKNKMKENADFEFCLTCIDAKMENFLVTQYKNGHFKLVCKKYNHVSSVYKHVFLEMYNDEKKTFVCEMCLLSGFFNSHQ